MKRYGYLFEQIVSFGNLLLASRKAGLGKKHKHTVADFYFHLETELFELQEELISGTYNLMPYHIFYVFEPKKRKICAAHFRDRVVHHAICNIIEPFFEKSFIYDTYACRKDKGTHRAIKKTQYFTRHNNYFFKGDIRKFFESIDHRILKNLLRKKFKDKKLLTLLDLIIEHPVEGNKPGKGLPIGNLTSQYFANYYLGQLDHFVKNKLSIKGYIRYMDDFIIFGEEKTLIKEQIYLIRDFLSKTLSLSLKEESLILAPVSQGIPFLGFSIFPSLIRLEGKKWAKFKRKIRAMEKEYMKGNIDELFLSRSISSRTGYLIHSSTLHGRRNFFSDRLNICIL